MEIRLCGLRGSIEARVRLPSAFESTFQEHKLNKKMFDLTSAVSWRKYINKLWVVGSLSRWGVWPDGILIDGGCTKVAKKVKVLFKRFILIVVLRYPALARTSVYRDCIHLEHTFTQRVVYTGRSLHWLFSGKRGNLDVCQWYHDLPFIAAIITAM